jgi:hypothetical protein
MNADTDCIEERSNNKRRDAVRYGTAGGVGVTAVAVGFLLNGHQALQLDLRRLADSQQLQAVAIERIQTSAATAHATNEAKHIELAARIMARELANEASTRDLEALHRVMAELGLRVTGLEQRRPELSASVPTPRPR